MSPEEEGEEWRGGEWRLMGSFRAVEAGRVGFGFVAVGFGVWFGSDGAGQAAWRWEEEVEEKNEWKYVGLNGSIGCHVGLYM